MSYVDHNKLSTPKEGKVYTVTRNTNYVFLDSNMQHVLRTEGYLQVSILKKYFEKLVSV